MRITKIRIKNYCQYKGEQTFSIPDDSKIIIIKGENGAGKTNLVNGLTWCLYHEHLSEDDLINDQVIHDTEIGKEIVMFIEIHFNHENRSHILKRELIGDKLSENTTNFKENYFIEIMEDAKITKVVDVLRIGNYVNNILNESVKNYFFFDGARIETFTKDDHYKDVEKAIKNLLKIETVVRAKNHIEVIVKEIRNSIVDEDHNSQYESRKKQIDELEKEHLDLLDEIKNLTDEILSVEKNIETSQEELDFYQKNSLYIEKKHEYEGLVNNRNTKLINVQSEVKQIIINSYIIFSDLLVKKARSVTEEKLNQQKKLLNPATLKEIIKRTIDTNKCFICEEDLKDGNKELLSKKLLDVLDIKELDENLSETLQDFNNLQREGKELYNLLREKKKSINEYESDISEFQTIIENCESNSNEELPDINGYKNLIKKLLADKENKVLERKEINAKAVEKKALIDQLEEENKEIGKRFDKFKKEQRRLELCYKIRNELEIIFDNYEKVEVEKINSEIKSIFDLIIRKENLFKEIFIDHEYRLNVKREYSTKNVLKQLSYGERQILSFSLIMALAKVSGDQGPFVMDTPMGNLDPIHRTKLIENVPKMIEQMILLVTSSEFTVDLEQLCDIYSPIKFHLISNKDGSTEIRKEY